jgi:hypothetical protein
MKMARHGRIYCDNQIWKIDFFDDWSVIGTIAYPHNSIEYVRDALENWESGVMTEEVVRFYSDQMEFDFSEAYQGGVENWR